MSISRRKFLKTACAGTCGAAIHSLLSPTGSFMAFADPQTGASSLNTKVLVLVFLGGGCSYNIANPLNSAYLQINPTCAFTPNSPTNAGLVLPGNEQVLHPSLTAFKSMFDQGKAALVNLVGYPNADRSHDTSTKIWQTGVLTGFATTEGWGAKVACTMGSLFSGISLSGSNTLTEGTCLSGGSFTSLNSLNNTQSNFWWENSQGNLFMADVQRNVLLDGAPPPGPSAQYIQEQMDSYDAVVKTVANATNFGLQTTFPNTSIGQQLRDAAKLIVAPNLNTKLIYTAMGGFDTHSDERTRLSQLLGDLNAAVGAFFQEITLQGRLNDVTLVTMSEFGRTVAENASGGTDHGHAAPMFVLGGQVAGGIKTPAPTLAETQTAQNFSYYKSFHVDFRDVLSHAIAHIGVDPTPIFPQFGKVQGLQLFA
ncbi:MAG: DUF1501 domain-containing protein [Oligoflexia bacterium]|nr:DUF1501 domain-containing protein [Oligoflexia bacterium]